MKSAQIRTARRELGFTRISRRHTRWTIVGFAVLLLAVPLGQLLYRALAPEEARLRLVPFTVQEGFHGWEEALAEASWWRRWILPPMQQWLLQAGRTGNETVVIGDDGWLFAASSIQYLAHPGFLQPERLRKRQWRGIAADPVAAVLDLARQLRERGMELVVVTVPPKPALTPEPLGSSAPPGALFNPDFDVFRKRVESAGVRVVDLTDALSRLRSAGGEAFLQTDTHWRPEAVPVAAAAIAEALHFSAFEVATETAWVMQTGDLVPLLKLPRQAEFYPPERVPVARVLNCPAGEAQILLVGDSFTNIYSLPGMGWGEGGGLAEHLAARLRQPVDRIARNGNGAYASREALARHPELLTGKTLVIWEFAMRELADGDWKILPLPAEQVPEVQTGHRRVSGRIVALSEPPRPGRTVYPNHLMSALVRTSEGDMLFYLEAVRERRLTDAAYWRVGDPVTLEAQPWEAREAEYADWSRSELPDPALWELPQWFATPL